MLNLLKLMAVIFLSMILACAVSKKDFPVSELMYPDSLKGKIHTRAEWGWKSLQDTIVQHQIDKITIHHSGVEFKEGSDVVAYTQHLQDWSRAEKKWIDIPYHFLIAPSGDIYEARPINYPGDTNTDYDVRGHALINVIGNFEVQTVTEEQLQSTIELSAFLAKTYDVSAFEIKGHKDYTETLCPGKDLYRYLQDSTIRKSVQYILDK